MPAHKTVLRFALNRDRALATAEYLLSRLGPEYYYMSLLKLIFFADRYHIRKYARPVTSDTYYAMEQGPVASFLLNVFHGKFPAITEIKPGNDYTVKLVKKSNRLEWLSKSDIEAIEFSIKHFAKFNKWDLVDITHAYPEWRRYKKEFEDDEAASEPVYIEDFLGEPDTNDPKIVRLKFKDPFDVLLEDEKKELLEDIEEYCANVLPTQ
jgi:uncharacterized phage-associated protein